MKKMYITAIALVVATIGFGQDMTISGIYDGSLSGGTPKGVEIYVINDIADLSIYGLGSANNGGGTDGEEFTFPADAASAGDFIYVSTEEPNFNAFFGFNPNYTGGSMAINGDDAVELFMNGTIVDIFGDPNTDGSGQPWEYLDSWTYKNSNIAPSATFTIGDWTLGGVNAYDGESTNASAATPMPIGTFTYDNLSNNLFDDASVSVYPNPTVNTLTFKSSINNIGSFKIFNTSGQLLINSKGNLSNKSIDVSNLSKGSYILKVTSNDNSHTYKFIK